jgi:fibronectin-binding autotransporter adhesin
MRARFPALLLLGVLARLAPAEDNTALVFDAVATNLAADLVVGDAGTNNTVAIRNGAGVTSEESALGNGPGASGNGAVVEGTGTEWRTLRLLAVGVRGGANTLVATNGAAVLADQGVVGQFAGSSSNALVVYGAGSTCAIHKDLTVGWSGEGNEVLVAGGGWLGADRGAIGLGPEAWGNRVTVSAAGSVWTNSGALTVGWEGARSELSVLDGGRVYSSFGQVGLVWTASNSTVRLGDGAMWLLSSNLTIGGDAPGNLLAISNGTISCAAGVVGDFSRAVDNEAAVSGSASLWEVRGALTVGVDGSGNRLRVESGGRLASGSLVVGDRAAGCGFLVGTGAQAVCAVSVIGNEMTASSNSAVVRGAGAVWSNVTDLIVGLEGGGNSLQVLNGGRLETLYASLGYAASSGGNAAAVVGTGSLWRSSGSLSIGVSGCSNALFVTDGGRVVSLADLYVGEMAESGGNTIVVEGPDSELAVRYVLLVGAEGSASRLVLTNGGAARCSDLTIGAGASSVGNHVGLYSGSLSVTNYGDARLTVARGELVLESGSLEADALEIGDAGSALVATGFDLAGIGPVTNRGVLQTGGNTTFPRDVALAGNGVLVSASNGVTWTFGGSFHNASTNSALDLLHARIAFTDGAAHEFLMQAPYVSNSLAGFSRHGGVGTLVAGGAVDIIGSAYVWSLEGAGELTIGSGSKLYYVTDDAWSGSVDVATNGVFERIAIVLTNIGPAAGADVLLQWPGAADLHFAVEWIERLGEGAFEAATNITAAGDHVQWVDEGATNRLRPGESDYRAYRIHASP